MIMKISRNSQVCLWQEEGRRMRKEKGPSQQKQESHSFSAATSGVPTSRSFLLAGGRRHAPVFRWRIG